MKEINLAEYRARCLVERLFEDNSKLHGQEVEWPVVGGGYVSGFDSIDEHKELAVRALLARECFARNNASDLPPLPLSYDEREDLKGYGLLEYIMALFGRSLSCRKYDLKEHPPFADYASGVLWEAERVDGIIGGLANFPDKAKLKRRFPPRELAGMGPGFVWLPPERYEKEMADYRRSRSWSRDKKSVGTLEKTVSPVPPIPESVRRAAAEVNALYGFPQAKKSREN